MYGGGLEWWTIILVFGAVIVELVYSIRQQAYIWQLKSEVDTLKARVEKIHEMASIRGLMKE